MSGQVTVLSITTTSLQPDTRHMVVRRIHPIENCSWETLDKKNCILLYNFFYFEGHSYLCVIFSKEFALITWTTWTNHPLVNDLLKDQCKYSIRIINRQTGRQSQVATTDQLLLFVIKIHKFLPFKGNNTNKWQFWLKEDFGRTYHQDHFINWKFLSVYLAENCKT